MHSVLEYVRNELGIEFRRVRSETGHGVLGSSAIG